MICGLIGKARVGKDQFGEYLQECFNTRHRRTFTPMAFAKELKDMCQANFDLTDEQLWGDDKEIPDLRFAKKYNGVSSNPSDYWTPREIMQELGSFYRKITYNFWVESLGKTMEKRNIDDVIVTDVRHVNECEFVKERQGILIKIVRPDAAEIHGMLHESETALDGVEDSYFDIEINNDGTLEDLHDAAKGASDAIIIIENTIKKGRIKIDG